MNSRQRKLNNSAKYLKDATEFEGWSFRKIRIYLKRAAKVMNRCGLRTRF